MRRNRHGTTNIFAEVELRNYLEGRKQSVISSIESENDDYLLNVNENDYINHKVEEATIESLEIHIDSIYASSSEQMIPAEYFSSSFYVNRGNSYKKDVIKFHVPISGNQELLRYTPSSRLLWSIEVEISYDEFTFEIINFSDDTDAIVREKDSSLTSIAKQHNNVNAEVKQYNANLEAQIKSAFDSRKNRIKAKSGVLASLGVPIKKTGTAPETFSIPTPQKRKKSLLQNLKLKRQGLHLSLV